MQWSDSGSDGEYLGNDTNKTRRQQKLKKKNPKNPKSPKNTNLPKVKGNAIKEKIPNYNAEIKQRFDCEKKECPECGVSVRDLKRHLNAMHYGQKQICAHCAQELPSLLCLKDHIQTVHEKIPCDECGKLVARRVMKRHRDSVHTPNDQKKYKCDVCGKGFVAKDHLNDHKNIHTGEKPYKCKFCSACFASKGTHAMHERSHVGRRRDYSKK